tara:strand:- start:142 stop:432 length:291 start_codon:yes stop_codon:yes gene_type:complete
MPKVGKKEFDYTKKGKAKAKAYAEEIGQEVEYPTYDAGGRVKVYQDGGIISKKERNMLEKHKEHHSKKHMNEMKKDMLKGSSFNLAHSKAMKKVGN